MILLFSGTFFFTPSVTVAQTTQTAKIGLLNPITGSLSGQAPGFTNAYNLALEHLNAEAETTGWKFATEATLIKDTGTGDETKTTTAASALVTAGAHAVVGAASSSSSTTAVAILKDAKIPQVSYASTSPALTGVSDDGYFFRVILSDVYQGSALADLIKNTNADHKKVAVIHINDAYGTGLADAFETAFKAISDDHEVLVKSPYDQKAFTASTVISSVSAEAANLHAIVLITFVTDGAAIIGALNSDDDLKTKAFFGTDGLASDSLFDEASANGTDVITNLIGVRPLSADAAGSNFSAQFKEKYDADVDLFDREAYDATLLLGRAIIEADSTEGDKIRDAVTTVSHTLKGTATGNVSLDDNGDRRAGKYETWEILKADDGTLSYNATGVVEASAVETSDDSPFALLPLLGAFTVISAMVIAIISFRRRYA